MRLPAKVDYACKAVFELALHYKYRGEVPLQIGTISAAQKIPKNFLLQLLIRLKNAGLVRSTRGVSGGYFLAKHPSQIKLADVFRAIDDNIVDGPKRAKASPAGPESEKLLGRIWEGIGRDITASLEKISFEDLLSQLKKEQLTYFI